MHNPSNTIYKIEQLKKPPCDYKSQGDPFIQLKNSPKTMQIPQIFGYAPEFLFHASGNRNRQTS